MSSIPQVSEMMELILAKRALDLERQTGFVQRSTVELDGPGLCPNVRVDLDAQPGRWVFAVAPHGGQGSAFM